MVRISSACYVCQIHQGCPSYFHQSIFLQCRKLCGGSAVLMLGCHCGGLGSIPGQSTWGLWWKQLLWDRFLLPVLAVSPSEYCSTNATYWEIYLIADRLRETDVPVAAVEDRIRIRFVCCSFNDAVTTSRSIVLNGRMNDIFKEGRCARSQLYIA
jgi:hypothetical protein